jgi:hypothetical protein
MTQRNAVETEMTSLVDALEDAVRRGKTPDKAAIDLSQWVPREVLNNALAKFKERAALIRRLKIPAGFFADNEGGWYLGPRETDAFWPAMKTALAGRLTEEAVNSIDAASTKIVGHLPNPALSRFAARGLVLGYVQSGKTANYSAVIAKSADAGYKFVVVLSGIHEALRAQTQRRLNAEIVDLSSQTKQLWYGLTSPEADFRLGSATQPDAVLTAAHDSRVLAVIKKNGPRLRKLIKWAERADKSVLASCPLLVVDERWLCSASGWSCRKGSARSRFGVS